MYWNEEIETMDAERLSALQDERLREQVRYTYDRVPFYKKMFDEAAAFKSVFTPALPFRSRRFVSAATRLCEKTRIL